MSPLLVVEPPLQLYVCPLTVVEVCFVPSLSVSDPPPSATELSNVAVAPEPIAIAFTFSALEPVPSATEISPACAFTPIAIAA